MYTGIECEGEATRPLMPLELGGLPVTSPTVASGSTAEAYSLGGTAVAYALPATLRAFPKCPVRGVTSPRYTLCGTSEVRVDIAVIGGS